MNTPEHILQKIRMRNDLYKKDKSRDEEFERLSPLEKLRNVTDWELGVEELADQFIELAEGCGFEIKEGK